MTKPSIGCIVHYVSYGTPDGEYPKACRAAVITGLYGNHEAEVGLAVLNPEGMFFNTNVFYDDAEEPKGGTWHWPEPVEGG